MAGNYGKWYANMRAPLKTAVVSWAPLLNIIITIIIVIIIIIIIIIILITSHRVESSK